MYQIYLSIFKVKYYSILIVMDDELLTFSHNILPEPSIEQQKIIKAIKTKNVLVYICLMHQ